AGGGAIVDGNGPGVLNVNTGAGGGLLAFSGTGGVNLDTFTANLNIGVFGAGLADGTGNVVIRNSGLDLTVPNAFDGSTGGVTTGKGNVTITNNLNRSIALDAQALFVGSSAGGDVTITAGVVGAGAT